MVDVVGWKWAVSGNAKPINPALVELGRICEKCAQFGECDAIIEKQQEKADLEKKMFETLGMDLDEQRGQRRGGLRVGRDPAPRRIGAEWGE